MKARAGRGLVELAARLTVQGPRGLSDEDLLRILFEEGEPEAVDAAVRDCLELGDGLRGLMRCSAGELGHAGLPETWSRRLVAALALGRRAPRRRLPIGRPIRTGADVFRHLEERLGHQDREVFLALLLDARCRIAREIEVSRGSLTASLVHPREVFGPAVRHGACYVLVAHNHPSGDPEPSREDHEVTRRLRRAGELLGISLLDHVIIGANTYHSFLEANQL